LSISPSERLAWLGFSLVPGIGSRRLERLLTFFGSAENAWSSTESDLRACGLETQALENLLSARQQLNLIAEATKIERLGARYLLPADDEYPTLLRHIDDAPTVLYVRGTLDAHDGRAVAIVGTRKPTHYGSEVAYRFARDLASQGVTIVSGLAHGIDVAAHRGALDGEGRTIAVFGNGIDQIYPRDHTDIAQRIIEKGALISEFPVGSKPEARHFPARNRVISGLSLGVLIVEAPERSGALITATTAAEQGREVFAVPGSILSAASAGTNRLIQDGAQLVTSVNDILDALDLTTLPSAQTPAIRQEADEPNSDEERLILRMLSHEPIHVDDIIRQTKMSASLVLGTLTLLELKRLARNVGAMQYCLG